jgi:uncharacterized protein YegL
VTTLSRPGLRPVYVLLDTSGSTVRNGFAAACEQALPQLVDAASRRPGVLLSVLCYGTQAKALLTISDPADIRFIPELLPAGLSSLASGLQLLAESIHQDTAQLTADGLVCLPPSALVVADGLPTDPAADLVAARDVLDAAVAEVAEPAAPAPAPVYVSRPDDGDQLAVAALRMTYRPLAPGTPAELAASVLAEFENLLDS